MGIWKKLAKKFFLQSKQDKITTLEMVVHEHEISSKLFLDKAFYLFEKYKDTIMRRPDHMSFQEYVAEFVHEAREAEKSMQHSLSLDSYTQAAHDRLVAELAWVGAVVALLVWKNSKKDV